MYFLNLVEADPSDLWPCCRAPHLVPVGAARCPHRPVAWHADRRGWKQTARMEALPGDADTCWQSAITQSHQYCENGKGSFSNFDI